MTQVQILAGPPSRQPESEAIERAGRSCEASFNRQRVRGLMEYKTVTAGTREDGGQGVIEDSVELVAVLDAQVNDAIRLGWRPVGVVVTGPDGRMNQSMVRVR